MHFAPSSARALPPTPGGHSLIIEQVRSCARENLSRSPALSLASKGQNGRNAEFIVRLLFCDSPLSQPERLACNGDVFSTNPFRKEPVVCLFHVLDLSRELVFWRTPVIQHECPRASSLGDM